MKEYVVGFLVAENHQAVVLIEKQRPAWQRGRFNGVGGHVEPGESPEDAMRREFREEAGLDVEGWRRRVTLEGDGWRVYFFLAYRPLADVLAAKTCSDEPIIRVRPTLLPPRTIRNLLWLIPLCMDDDIEHCTLRDVGPAVSEGELRPVPSHEVRP